MRTQALSFGYRLSMPNASLSQSDGILALQRAAALVLPHARALRLLGEVRGLRLRLGLTLTLIGC